MTFLFIFAGGVLALLLLQSQAEGQSPEPTADDTTNNPQINPQSPEEKASFGNQGTRTALLAFGKATLGSQSSPALIGTAPDVVSLGSQFPPGGAAKLGIAGFQDPTTALKTGRSEAGLTFDPTAKSVAAGSMVSPGDSVTRPISPLTGLSPVLQSDSTRAGGDIPPPASATGSPAMTRATMLGGSIVRLGLPQGAWMESPAINGPPSVATIPTPMVSPIMPPSGIVQSPPSPPISMPPQQVGSPITAQPTRIGPPIAVKSPSIIPTVSGPSPVPATSPVPSPSFNPPPPTPKPIVPTTPAVVGIVGSTGGVRTQTV